MVENNIVTKHIPQETKNVVLTKKFKKAIYALAVRTTAQMVYMDDTYKYTLSEMITDIVNAIATSSERITILSEKLDSILQDAPEEMNTFKEVWEYVNVNGDSELAQTIRDMYTKGEVDDLIAEIRHIIETTPNAYIIDFNQDPESVKDGDIYYHIEENEIDNDDSNSSDEPTNTDENNEEP